MALPALGGCVDVEVVDSVVTVDEGTTGGSGVGTRGPAPHEASTTVSPARANSDATRAGGRDFRIPNTCARLGSGQVKMAAPFENPPFVRSFVGACVGSWARGVRNQDIGDRCVKT